MSADFPFVIDCATSINQRGKIEKYERLSLDTPRGMVIDYEGSERTDTSGVRPLSVWRKTGTISNVMMLY